MIWHRTFGFSALFPTIIFLHLLFLGSQLANADIVRKGTGKAVTFKDASDKSDGDKSAADSTSNGTSKNDSGDSSRHVSERKQKESSEEANKVVSGSEEVVEKRKESKEDAKEEKLPPHSASLISRIAHEDVEAIKREFEEAASKLEGVADGLHFVQELFSGNFQFRCRDPALPEGAWKTHCSDWERLWEPFRKWVELLPVVDQLGTDDHLLLQHLTVRPMLKATEKRVVEMGEGANVLVETIKAFVEIRTPPGYTEQRPPAWKNGGQFKIVQGWTRLYDGHAQQGDEHLEEVKEHLRKLLSDEQELLAGRTTKFAVDTNAVMVKAIMVGGPATAPYLPPSMPSPHYPPPPSHADYYYGALAGPHHPIDHHDHHPGYAHHRSPATAARVIRNHRQRPKNPYQRPAHYSPHWAHGGHPMPVSVY